MHTILVLVGCCGCGKDFIAKLLMTAYSGFHMVSTSKILGGGNKDGSLVTNDLFIQIRLENYLEEIGFFEVDETEPAKKFIFNGAGRNRIQMSSLIGTLKGCEYLENTKFIKLNIASAKAYRRMVDRFHVNLEHGTLRKEEEGDYDIVRGRFRSRIAEWHKTRVGIFESMRLNVPEDGIIDIDAGQNPAGVALDLVKAIGLPEGPMVDVLVNMGLLEKRLEDHEHHGKENREEEEIPVRVEVQ